MRLPEYIGSFRPIRVLGAGGMGEVFLALDPTLDRHVAIKRLLTSKAASPERVERFRREARLAARLDHPGVVRIYGMVESPDGPCIVMEYVDGETLRQVLSQRTLSVFQVVSIAQRIAEGIAEAHDRGIVHRDLKSENVLITRAGRVKIADFGVAEQLGDAGVSSDGVVVGTYRAMSPEQARGQSVGRHSDMFSFGVLLYEALTGRSPFDAATPAAILERLVYEHPAPIEQLRPELPSALVTLVRQLLAKEPMLRPRDFHDITGVLSEILGELRGPRCHGSELPPNHPPLQLLYDADTENESHEDPTH